MLLTSTCLGGEKEMVAELEVSQSKLTQELRMGKGGSSWVGWLLSGTFRRQQRKLKGRGYSVLSGKETH